MSKSLLGGRCLQVGVTTTTADLVKLGLSKEAADEVTAFKEYLKNVAMWRHDGEVGPKPVFRYHRVP